MPLNIFVPEPEPEETLHSLLVTAWRLSAYRSFQDFTEAIFKRASDGRGWTWNYKYLTKYLDPCRVTGIALLHNTLLLPYVIPFMSREAARLNLSRADGDRRLGEENSKPHWTPFNKRPLRYCPRCVQLQLRLLGRSLWLRPHQLERVEVCWQHSTYLASVLPHRTDPFLPHECEDQTIRYCSEKSEIWLARESQKLLSGNHAPTDASVRQAVLQERAERLLYGRGRRFDYSLIAVHLLRSFGRRFFQRVMGTSEVRDISRYMRSTIFGDDPSIRPINQLLCIYALFGDQQQFFTHVRAVGAKPLCGRPITGGPETCRIALTHRDIFLEQLKASGHDVMVRLAQRYPATHAWIIKNALPWSRRKIAALEPHGPDRDRSLRRKATELREQADRERELLRRHLSAIGSVGFDQPSPATVPAWDSFPDLAVRLRSY